MTQAILCHSSDLVRSTWGGDHMKCGIPHGSSWVVNWSSPTFFIKSESDTNPMFEFDTLKSKSKSKFESNSQAYMSQGQAPQMSRAHSDGCSGHARSWGRPSNERCSPPEGVLSKKKMCLGVGRQGRGVDLDVNGVWFWCFGKNI